MKHEDGFHFLEFPSPRGKAEALVLVLHGHANHPEMFTKLVPEIHRQYPQADVLIVQAPFALKAGDEHKSRHGVPHVEDLYTWHKLEKQVAPHAKLMLGHTFNRIPVVQQLNRFLDAQLQKRGLATKNLALFGFSMGGSIAVQTAIRRKEKCAAVVCHSGTVLPATKARMKPDVLMLMGDQDAIFYTQKISLPPPQKPGRLKNAFHKVAKKVSFHHDDSVKRLEKAGVPVTNEIVPGLKHTISADSFDRAMKFISPRLRKP